MWKLSTLFLLASVVFSVGCAKSEYWVRGLTLPPGSTVTSKSETTELGGPAAMMPGVGQVDKTLLVTFENAAGWHSVSTHIDGCMKQAGYTDTMSGLSSYAASMPKEASGFLDGMKYYTKVGEKYAVMLMDMAGMMQEATKGQTPPPGVPGMSGFNLTVMKLK